MQLGNSMLIAATCLIIYLVPNVQFHLYGADTGQHIEQINAIKYIFSKGEDASIYTTNLITPYLLPYMTWVFFSYALESIRIDQIIFASNLILFISSIQYYFSVTKSNPYFIPCAVATFFGLPFQWGFHPFIFSVSIGLFLLSTLIDKESKQRVILIPTLSILLILSHGLTAAFFACIIAFRSIFIKEVREKLENYALAAFLFMTVVAWKALSGSAFPGLDLGIRFSFHFFESPYTFFRIIDELNSSQLWGHGRLSGLFSRAFGIQDSLIATAAGAAIMILPWLLGFQLKKDLTSAAPFIAIVISIIFMPTSILGAVFAHDRFSILIIPTYFTVFEIKKSRTSLSIFLSIALLLALHQHSLISKESKEISALHNLIDELPENMSALYLDYSHPEKSQQAPYFMHTGHIYSHLKNGNVMPSFASLNLQPVIYKKEFRPDINISSGHEWFPAQKPWKSYSSYQYDIIIIRGSREDLEAHMRRSIRGRTWRNGNWFACYNPLKVKD